MFDYRGRQKEPRTASSTCVTWNKKNDWLSFEFQKDHIGLTMGGGATNNAKRATDKAKQACTRRKILCQLQIFLLQRWKSPFPHHTRTLADIRVMCKKGSMGWDEVIFSPLVAKEIRTDPRAQQVVIEIILAKVPIKYLREVICITIVWSTDEVEPQPQPKRWRTAAQNSRNRRFPDKHEDVQCPICCGELADVKLHCGKFICSACLVQCDICPFCRGTCWEK